MISKKIPLLLAIGFGLMFSSTTAANAAKLEFPAASPGCTIKQRVGLTDVEVVYSRPGVKGRDEIFGKLLPFGKVWRTGANAATKVVFSTPVKLNGTEVPAGTYSLMTIPDKDEWTVIINKGGAEGGHYNYDEKQDLVRFKAKPITVDKSLDAFTIEFDDIRDESATMKLAWDKTVVPIEMKVDYTDQLTKQIDEVMASSEEKKPYFQSAQFYFNHGGDLDKALKWVDAALADKEMFYIVHLKAQILAKKGDKAGAIAAAKRSTELAEKANDTAYVKLNEALLTKLQ